MAASHALYQLSYGPIFLLLSALMLRCASEPSGHTGDNLLPSGPVPGDGNPSGANGRPTTMQTDRTAPSVAASVGDIRTVHVGLSHSLTWTRSGAGRARARGHGRGFNRSD
jgi:hypothetical protein